MAKAKTKKHKHSITWNRLVRYIAVDDLKELNKISRAPPKSRANRSASISNSSWPALDEEDELDVELT
jgi:hypothetical protein